MNEFVQLENDVYVLLVYDWRWNVWQGTWFQKVGRWCLCSGTFITILNFLPTLTNSILLDWRYGRWLLFLFPFYSPSHSTPFIIEIISKFIFELYSVWIFPGCTKAEYIYAIWQWSACLSRKRACQARITDYDAPFGYQVQV